MGGSEGGEGVSALLVRKGVGGEISLSRLEMENTLLPSVIYSRPKLWSSTPSKYDAKDRLTTSHKHKKNPKNSKYR